MNDIKWRKVLLVTIALLFLSGTEWLLFSSIIGDFQWNASARMLLGCTLSVFACFLLLAWESNLLRMKTKSLGELLRQLQFVLIQLSLLTVFDVVLWLLFGYSVLWLNIWLFFSIGKFFSCMIALFVIGASKMIFYHD